MTAVCSWIAVSTRGSPGLRAQRPAIVSPRPTEIVTSASATIPEARLASHQECWARAGAHAAAPIRPTSSRGTVICDPPARIQRTEQLDLAAVVDQEAAAAGQELAAPFGAGEQRRLGERLRLERRVAERRGADQAGPGGLAGGGIEQVVGEPAVARPATDVTFRPDVAMPPEPASTTCARSPVSGFSTSMSNGRASVAKPPTRMSPPQSTTKRP